MLLPALERMYPSPTQFLKALSKDTLRWYIEKYDSMLDDPVLTSPTIRLSFALLNAELARRTEL